MIVGTVVRLLQDEASVAAIVGDRVYPLEAPDEATYPLVIVTKVAGPGNYDMKGDVGLEQARLQIDCYGAGGYAANVELHTAVRRFLSGFSGGEPSLPCQIESSFCINDLDLREPATERAGPRVRRRMLEFLMWTREV